MNFLARCRGCQIMEIPIHFTDRAVGQSKMDFRVKVESALRPWRLRWQYRGECRAAASGRAHSVPTPSSRRGGPP
jgi:dolichol-phosphate mannosyltransferase